MQFVDRMDCRDGHFLVILAGEGQREGLSAFIGATLFDSLCSDNSLGRATWKGYDGRFFRR
jgi:hypothetical protein